MPLRTLLIDNYDSYTYNLFQLLAEVTGVEPLVYKNDAITVEQVQDLLRRGEVHNIVISPGPGSPEHAGDVGVCLHVLQQLQSVPVFGVCLGHQALAAAAGARIVRAPEPVHGRVSELWHTGHALFKGIPSGPKQGFEVVRYHSLVVEPSSLPDFLQPIAWATGTHHAVSTKAASQAMLAQQQEAAAAAEIVVDGSHMDAQCQLVKKTKQHLQADGVVSATAAACSNECVHASPGKRQHDRPVLLGKLQDGMQQNEQGLPQAPVAGSTPLLMGLAHKSRPHYGVQFHPESICTRFGMQLLLNFYELACSHLGVQPNLPRSLQIVNCAPGRVHDPHPWPSPQQQSADQPLGLLWCKCASAVQPQDASQGLLLFEALFSWRPHTFWLDSATMDRGRHSFMGAQGGPLWRLITYKLPHPQRAAPAATGTAPAGLFPLADVELPQHTAASNGTPGAAATAAVAESGALWADGTPDSGPPAPTAPAGGGSVPACGTVSVQDAQGRVASARVPLFSYLRRLVDTHQLQVPPATAAQLPFNFWGGLVGYLSYELKVECGGSLAHAAHTPDAALMFADRLLVVDHASGDVFLLALHDQRGAGGEESRRAQEAWLDQAQAEVVRLCQEARGGGGAAGAGAQGGGVAAQQTGGAGMPAGHQEGGRRENGIGVGDAPLLQSPPQQQQQGCLVPDRTLRLRHNKQRYLQCISGCLSALHAGESYEVCLTTALLRRGAPRPDMLYKQLRSLNPAPYAAWLHFGDAGPICCCSSPERFLRGDRGGVLEARPIKGTAARWPGDAAADARAAQVLATSEKDRAENLMIVDLLRNDLGAVCEVGSVHVPGLMEIESYATVHQMVSTVRGVRRRGVGLVDALQAAFPAGSMTGAPKVRTMAIIDELEGAARGVYSGCIGFISLNDCFDLNVVIRTAVIDRGSAAAASASACDGEGAQDIRRLGSDAADPAVGPPLAAGRETWAGLDEALVSIGTGGAIVVQSELEDEFQEMRLKARALLAAIGHCDGSSAPAVLDDEHAWSDYAL